MVGHIPESWCMFSHEKRKSWYLVRLTQLLLLSGLYANSREYVLKHAKKSLDHILCGTERDISSPLVWQEFLISISVHVDHLQRRKDMELFMWQVECWAGLSLPVMAASCSGEQAVAAAA